MGNKLAIKFYFSNKNAEQIGQNFSTQYLLLDRKQSLLNRKSPFGKPFLVDCQWQVLKDYSELCKKIRFCYLDLNSVNLPLSVTVWLHKLLLPI